MRAIIVAWSTAIAAFLAVSSGVASADGLDEALHSYIETYDCGKVDPKGENRSAVNGCVRRMFARQKPFRARYEIGFFDSEVAAGVVLSRTGALYVIKFDSGECGGDSKEAACGTVTYECDHPRIRKKGLDGIRVSCTGEYNF